MKHTIAFCIISVICFACADDFTNTDTSSGKLVVDGYIEVGRQARVILTTSLALDSQIDSSKYLDVVTTRADIRISDGEHTEYLTLKRDRNLFPQHYYESSIIRGQEGKTYTIEIFYRSDTLTASTTIPQNSVSVDSMWTVQSDTDSNSKYIWIRFCDDGEPYNYYRSFTRILQSQSEFIPTYLSAFDNALIRGECVDLPIYKGPENFYEKERDFSFTKGDTVLLKIASIDNKSYLFWNNYEKEVFNVGNPFAGHGSNLTSNISGGLGIWSGYNQSVYVVIVR